MSEVRRLGLDVRPATAADLEFAWEVYREAMRPLTEALPYPWRDEGQRDGIGRDLASGHARVVERAGTPVGWFLVRPDADSDYLGQLYVAAAERSHGVGTAIVRDLLTAGERPVRLSVLRNNAGALALYRRLGFDLEREDDLKLHLVRPPTGRAGGP